MEPASGSTAWLPDMPVSRWPMRTDSGKSSPVPLVEHRLVIECLQLRRTTRHEQVNHPFRFRCEMQCAQVPAMAGVGNFLRRRTGTVLANRPGQFRLSPFRTDSENGAAKVPPQAIGPVHSGAATSAGRLCSHGRRAGPSGGVEISILIVQLQIRPGSLMRWPGLPWRPPADGAVVCPAGVRRL